MSKVKKNSEQMRPLIKYPGGKEKELKIITACLPEQVENYYEPFVGGGAVFFSLNPGKNKYINDKSNDLINFYRCVKDGDESFFRNIEDWDRKMIVASEKAQENIEEYRKAFEENRCPEGETADVGKLFLSKYRRIMKKAEREGEIKDLDAHLESVLKQKVFLDARDVYNTHEEFDGERAAAYVMMRQYGFSGMFRFNADGKFNIPYGGIAYNQKYLSQRIETMRSDRVKEMMERTTIGCSDFYDFMQKYPPERNDFVFLDPPYDCTFSTYDQNEFGAEDQRRLAAYLIKKCRSNWMVVMKATDFIRSLYTEGTECINGGTINITEFDKQYDVCIKGRNDKKSEHLVITNYVPGGEDGKAL